MSIQSLWGDTDKRDFVEQYFHKLPYSRPGGAKEFCELGSWEMLGEILAARDVDCMVVRRGERVEGADPKSLQVAQQLIDEGCTILVRHAERHDERLAQLAAGFAAEFAGEVNIHFYCTPAEQFGFGWHYDAEEVFILQTQGKKEYSLRKNTVNPWPLVEQMPADLRYEREIMPLMKCTLSAGDWLYIPSGYWHKAAALKKGTGVFFQHGPESASHKRPPSLFCPALSLAVGVMSPAALALYDFLRARLLDSLLWRQRLLAAQDEAQRLDQLRQLAELLSDDLAKQLRDEKVLREFLASLSRDETSMP